MAPAAVREELNRTFTMYRYLSGMTSEIALAASVGFFLTEHRVAIDEANHALRVLRSPEKMREFRFASDLMAEFARLVCVYRDQRLVLEKMMRERGDPPADCLSTAEVSRVLKAMDFTHGPRD